MTPRLYPVKRSGSLFTVRASIRRSQAPPSIINLLVDTGAGKTSLSTTLLTDIGYPVISPSPAIAIMTGNGIVRMPVVQIPWLSCLGQRVEDFSVLALELPIDRYFSGILGMDFLLQFKAVIDVGKGQILLP
jgi:predicted aspartyl protease